MTGLFVLIGEFKTNYSQISEPVKPSSLSSGYISIEKNILKPKSFISFPMKTFL